MPGKTRRAARYDQILQRNPILHLATNKKAHPIPLSHEEYLAFVESVCLGLFKRIQLRNDQEAIALTGAFGCLQSRFSDDVSFTGIQEAKNKVIKFIARSSIPKLKQITQPSPLRLAQEASHLDATIPPRKDIKKRRCWVTGQGLPAETAMETDADLIEIILAKRHEISRSHIHKVLARAARFGR